MNFRILLLVSLVSLVLSPMVRAAPPEATFAPEFFAFQNGVHFGTAAERAKVLKELGYDGIGSANPGSLKERLKHYDQVGLKIYSLYVGGRASAAGPQYAPAIDQAIKELKGRDTFLELYVQGAGGTTDEHAVAFVQEIADKAAESNLKVVLYPHTGFYIDNFGDAVRIAKLAKRQNVGVMFNLCHYLRVEPKLDVKSALEDARPYLWRVSVCGADDGGKSWGQLIQTLDRGTYDQVGFLKILKEVGFDGVVGLQCYAVRGDSRENLKRSVTAWQKNLRQVQGEQ